jgi:steroid 5-alpha reductase family enzyme
MQTSVFMWSALVILAAVLVVWAISVKIKDASIVDVFWGFGFVLVAWVARLVAGGDWTLRRTLLLVAATAWGLRLTWHLGRRNLGKGEDFRYRAMRKKHGDKFWLVSLRTVFLFQGLMIFIVSLPLQVGLMRHDDRSEITALVLAGFVVWCIGVGFETLGDLQLKRFKANPANKGTILATGLWAWTQLFWRLGGLVGYVADRRLGLTGNPNNRCSDRDDDIAPAGQWSPNAGVHNA